MSWGTAGGFWNLGSLKPSRKDGTGTWSLASPWYSWCQAEGQTHSRHLVSTYYKDKQKDEWMDEWVGEYPKRKIPLISLFASGSSMV